jgi:hypothetical protein
MLIFFLLLNSEVCGALNVVDHHESVWNFVYSSMTKDVCAAGLLKQMHVPSDPGRDWNFQGSKLILLSRLILA